MPHQESRSFIHWPLPHQRGSQAGSGENSSGSRNATTTEFKGTENIFRFHAIPSQIYAKYGQCECTPATTPGEEY